MKVVLLSYCPLFDHRKYNIMPGQTLDPDRIKDLDLPDGIHVRCCLWTMDKADGQVEFAPVLIMDQAKKIVYHLMEWTEGKPRDWFKLIVTDNGYNYCVALFPDAQKSIDRWKLGYQLTHGGQEPPKSYEYEVIFKPLVFGAGISESYRNVSKHLSKSMELGILDSQHFDPSQPFKIDSKKVIQLGRYELADPTQYKGWSDNYLTNLAPPEGGSRSLINPKVKLES